MLWMLRFVLLQRTGAGDLSQASMDHPTYQTVFVAACVAGLPFSTEVWVLSSAGACRKSCIVGVRGSARW